MNIVPVEIPLGIILEKTKFNISKIIIHNDSSKAQKNCWLKFLAFWNICKPKTQLIKIHYSLDFSRPHGRLLGNSKTCDFWGLFLPENSFKTCSVVNSRKRLEKGILWFYGFILFEVHSQQRWFITGGSFCWSVIRRKKT